MKKIERIRDVLERNEIFITASQTLLIGLVGLFLSIGNYRMQKLQTAASEYEHLPHIRVDNILGYDADRNVYAHDKIEVFNDGYDLWTADIKDACFLEIAYSTRADPEGRILLPLNGYYSAGSYTNSRRGRLFPLLGLKNNSRMTDLIFEFRKLTRDTRLYPNLDIRKYLRVKYSDFKGKSREEYFIVDPVYGGQPIDSNLGSNLFTQHHQAYGDRTMLEFDQVSAEQLARILESKVHEKSPRFPP